MKKFVLTGGLSKRMGYPKSELKIKNRTFREIIEKKGFIPIGSNILYNAKYDDILPRGSSLSGIISALFYSDEKLCIIHSCDNPFISDEIIKKLSNKKRSTFYFIDDFIIPFPGVYEKKFLKLFIRAFKRRELGINKILRRQKINLLKPNNEEEKILKININKKEIYKSIRR